MQVSPNDRKYTFQIHHHFSANFAKFVPDVTIAGLLIEARFRSLTADYGEFMI